MERSRRVHPVVYLDGDGELDYQDLVKVIDAARDSWYGVEVVLLTPELKKVLSAKQTAH